MNVYLSYSIAGKDNYSEALSDMEELARAMILHTDTVVWVPHVFTVGATNVAPIQDENGNPMLCDGFLYALDIAAASHCHMTVVIMDSQSVGVGMEVQRAYDVGNYVLILAEAGTKLSKMVTGLARESRTVDLVRIPPREDRDGWLHSILKVYSATVAFLESIPRAIEDQAMSAYKRGRDAAIARMVKAKYAAVGWLGRSHRDYSSMLHCLAEQLGSCSEWEHWGRLFQAVGSPRVPRVIEAGVECLPLFETESRRVLAVVERGPHYLRVLEVAKQPQGPENTAV